MGVTSCPLLWWNSDAHKENVKHFAFNYPYASENDPSGVMQVTLNKRSPMLEWSGAASRGIV